MMYILGGTELSIPPCPMRLWPFSCLPHHRQHFSLRLRRRGDSNARVSSAKQRSPRNLRGHCARTEVFYGFLRHFEGYWNMYPYMSGNVQVCFVFVLPTDFILVLKGSC